MWFKLLTDKTFRRALGGFADSIGEMRDGATPDEMRISSSRLLQVLFTAGLIRRPVYTAIDDLISAIYHATDNGSTRKENNDLLRSVHGVVRAIREI
jgi:F420-dependent methylenetetrahydromethanopterin dehydrogenase